MAVTISSSVPGGAMSVDLLAAVRSRGLLDLARARVFQHRVDVWVVFDRLVDDFRLFTVRMRTTFLGSVGGTR